MCFGILNKDTFGFPTHALYLLFNIQKQYKEV